MEMKRMTLLEFTVGVIGLMLIMVSFSYSAGTTKQVPDYWSCTGCVKVQDHSHCKQCVQRFKTVSIVKPVVKPIVKPIAKPVKPVVKPKFVIRENHGDKTNPPKVLPPKIAFPIEIKDKAHQLPGKGIHRMMTRIGVLGDDNKTVTPFRYGVVRIKSDNKVTNWEYQTITNAYGLFEFAITDINEFRLCAWHKGQWNCLKNKMSVSKLNRAFMKSDDNKTWLPWGPYKNKTKSHLDGNSIKFDDFK